jgi:hypothetical protein
VSKLALVLNTSYIPEIPLPKPVPKLERSEAEGCVIEKIPAFPRNERSEEGLSSPNQPANPRNERSEEGWAFLITQLKSPRNPQNEL